VCLLPDVDRDDGSQVHALSKSVVTKMIAFNVSEKDNVTSQTQQMKVS